MFFTHVLLPEQTCFSTLNSYIYEINKLAWVIPHLISAQMWSSSLSLHRCQISTLKLLVTVSSNPKTDKLKLIISMYGQSFLINRNVPFVLMKVSLGKSNSEQTSFEVHKNFA